MQILGVPAISEQDRHAMKTTTATASQKIRERARVSQIDKRPRADKIELAITDPVLLWFGAHDTKIALTWENASPRSDDAGHVAKLARKL
jgi:hypothetical protein